LASPRGFEPLLQP